MEMEKTHYVVSFRPEYLELVRSSSNEPSVVDDVSLNPVVVAITQGGFGQDIIDDERQVKERFLEYVFSFHAIDLGRSVETFDAYFDLKPVEEFVDLDEEL
ncbi:MAG TPA: hypothetical protein VEZ90_01575 [Blastocatellia bacterium]|nr:hypothetical protein [Blastocatellia bacterium]